MKTCDKCPLVILVRAFLQKKVPISALRKYIREVENSGKTDNRI